MSLLVIGTLLPWILLAVMAWALYTFGLQFVYQNKRFVFRMIDLAEQIESLQDAVSAPGNSMEAEGLPVGSIAPPLELPDVNGAMNKVSLEQFRGNQVLLIFSSPGCHFCQEMAPELAKLPYKGEDGHPLPVVITTGGLEANREMIAQHNLRMPFLLQEDTEFFAPFGVIGTPEGYLIGSDGAILSNPLMGADSLLKAFADPEAARKDATEHAAAAEGEKQGLKMVSKNFVPNSKIKRDGLEAGTEAPNFTLPLVTGTKVTLREYFGKPMVLVFSDPNCGPCQELAPELEKAHQANPSIQFFMVSRGKPEENLTKIREHGLTFPVALQRQWEVSRAYAMFATPVAYLIDPKGVLASDVAVGKDSILKLVPRAAALTDGKEVMALAN